MKKIIALLACTLFVLTACSAPGSPQAQETQSGAAGAASTSSSETAEAAQPGQGGKPDLVIMGEENQDYSRAAEAKRNVQVDATTSALYSGPGFTKLADKDYTVMVYIVGSNLESHYGAATNDMNEMISADLDYNKSNLVVYAGGAKRWNSDISNTYNSVLDLSKDKNQLVTAQTAETADMGAPQTLAEFINYCTANYPARHYGLILWDHGAGPLWGYGSDELFNNDSLLLEELRTAMDETMFAGEKKLDWVGFDACLMGSVESAKLWQNYAHYLIGSEELESGRGWDYSFLSVLNETDDARTIAESIVDAYGNYYETNTSEFFNPAATLAAMDLSHTDELITSMNTLFSAMENGIEEGNYADLNRARSRTRAFGLAAASGKADAFDLLDLRDFTENLTDLYPEETEKVRNALDRMVVRYTSNVSGANGVSFYLPGDNLELYGVSEELSSEETVLSSEYSDYVQSYMDTRIEGTNADWTLGEIERNGDELTLQLTEEQVKNISKASYTVLQRNGMGSYAIATAYISIEPDEDGVLHMPSDPLLINASTDLEEAPAPLTCLQEQKNGDECIYKTVRCFLVPGHEFMDPDSATDEEVVITVKNIEGEKEATILDISSSNGSAWAGGKGSVDVSNYNSLVNAGSIAFTPQRDEEGNMKPFLDWKYMGYERYSICLEKGFRVEMKAASEYDYDFICQVTVTDINGEEHGSEYINLQFDKEGETASVETPKGVLYADVSGENAVIIGYKGEDEILTVPSQISGKTVTSLGRYSLAGSKTITELNLPDTVTEIRDKSLIGLGSCSTIHLPQGLKTIGIEAFQGTAITEIDIPDGVESIGRNAFSHTMLTTVKLPDGLEYIGAIPFRDCKYLKEITISDNNESYKTVDGVLYSKDGKTLIQYPAARSGEYTVEKGTERIEYGAFADSLIEGVVFPDTIKEVANMAFFDSQRLASFNLPDSLEYIGNSAFGDYGMFSYEDEKKTVIEQVHIGPNVKYIGTSAFNMIEIKAFDVDEKNPYYASSGGFITSKAKDIILEVPDAIESPVVIPDGITTLQDDQFTMLDENYDFLIPDSTYRFGKDVFPYKLGDRDENGKYVYIYRCTLHCSEGSAAEKYAMQKEISFDNITEPDRLVYETVTEDMTVGPKFEPATLTWRVYKDRAELYDILSDSEGTFIVPSSYRDRPVTAIKKDPDTFFSSSTHFEKIVIPDTIQYIDTEIFTTFYGLKEFEIDENNPVFKSVDGVLFDKEGKTLLSYPRDYERAAYDVPNKTETIADKAFYMNSKLCKVTFPKTLRVIGYRAFTGCSQLTDAEFNKGLKEIGGWAFSDCMLTDVKLSSTITFIGDSAFTLNEGFGRIELPKKLEKLGYHVFRGPKDNPLKQDVITIPEELLVTEAFLDGILFEKYEVDEKNENHTAVDGLLMSKDGQTLVSVPTLKEGDLVIPDGTLYISYTALEGCDKITDIYLPDSILNIGNAGAKNYDTGEYYYVIHCSEGTEAQKLLDAKGIPWVAK